jgi:hypothetical protein
MRIHEELQSFVITMPSLVGRRSDPFAADQFDLAVVNIVEIDDGLSPVAESGEKHDATARPGGTHGGHYEVGMADGENDGIGARATGP